MPPASLKGFPKVGTSVIASYARPWFQRRERVTGDCHRKVQRTSQVRCTCGVGFSAVPRTADGGLLLIPYHVEEELTGKGFSAANG